jgi:peptide/nickel transport system substrate-binding protein
MHEQATNLDPKKRKAAFDRVQEIVWEQEPFIYLVNRNALSAVSPNARNVHPVVLRPQVYWNIDEISIGNEVARNR